MNASAMKAFDKANHFLAQAANERDPDERKRLAALACKDFRGMSDDEKKIIAVRAVELYERVYHALGWRMQEQEEICIAFVRNDTGGTNLKRLLFENRVTDNVALAAVKACGQALQYAGSTQRNNSSIADAAIAQDKRAAEYVGPVLVKKRFDELEALKLKVATLEAENEELKAQRAAEEKEHADADDRKRKRTSDEFWP